MCYPCHKEGIMAQYHAMIPLVSIKWAGHRLRISCVDYSVTDCLFLVKIPTISHWHLTPICPNLS